MTNPGIDPVDVTEKSGPDFEVVAEKAPPRRLLPGRGAPQRETGAKDTPPRSTRARKKASSTGGAKPKVEVPEYQPGKIAEGLSTVYGGIGMMVGMFDPHCGGVIVSNAQAMANSMEKLAKESPAARAFLEKLITTSAIGEVVAAHLPVVAMIASHHIPAFRNRTDTGAQEFGNMGVPGSPEHGQAA
jgi:hypothetical protein